MSRHRRQQKRRMRKHAGIVLVQCPGCRIYRKSGPRCPVPFCRLGRPTVKDLMDQAKRNGRIYDRIKRKHEELKKLTQ